MNGFTTTENPAKEADAALGKPVCSDHHCAMSVWYHPAEGLSYWCHLCSLARGVAQAEAGDLVWGLGPFDDEPHTVKVTRSLLVEVDDPADFGAAAREAAAIWERNDHSELARRHSIVTVEAEEQ